MTSVKTAVKISYDESLYACPVKNTFWGIMLVLAKQQGGFTNG